LRLLSPHAIRYLANYCVLLFPYNVT
jgi:hypothetical protein